MADFLNGPFKYVYVFFSDKDGRCQQFFGPDTFLVPTINMDFDLIPALSIDLNSASARNQAKKYMAGRGEFLSFTLIAL